jgi:hypothetical protein
MVGRDEKFRQILSLCIAAFLGYVSHPLSIIIVMDVPYVEQAVEALERANADLDPDLLDAVLARRLMAAYARAGKLAAFGVAALSRKVCTASEIARVTGSSMGKAHEVVVRGKVLAEGGALTTALKHGEISLEQAAEIASAEASRPGAAAHLVTVAQKEPFHVLKDKARAVKLEAEQH